jgi:hypothetical protein
MDVSKETGVGDSRAVYTPPVVVRINDLKQGAGLCASTGSGDAAECRANGNTAAPGPGGLRGCIGNGNSAYNCNWTGSGGHA